MSLFKAIEDNNGAETVKKKYKPGENIPYEIKKGVFDKFHELLNEGTLPCDAAAIVSYNAGIPKKRPGDIRSWEDGIAQWKRDGSKEGVMLVFPDGRKGSALHARVDDLTERLAAVEEIVDKLRVLVDDPS